MSGVSGLINASLSGLQAAQEALQVTGNNIANVNTPGYSQETVVQSTLTPSYRGGQFYGNGTQISNVQRVYSSFLQGQVWSATAGASGASTLSQNLQQVMGLLSSGSVSSQIQQFFSGVAQVAASPSDLPARQTLLGNAQSLSSNFQSLAQQLNSIGQGVNQQLQQGVQTVNSLSKQIAQLNQQIASLQGEGNGNPNDLLDQQAQLITQLSAQVGVQVMQQGNQTNVYLSNGQVLVAGAQAFSLVTRPSNYDQQSLTIAYSGSLGSESLSQGLVGGALGGLLQFRQQSLIPAQNGLGLLADGLAATLNQQQAKGLNLYGSSGSALFSLAPVQIFANAQNQSSGASVQGQITNVANLQGQDYILQMSSGGVWELRNASTGAVVDSTSGSSSGGVTNLNFSQEGFQLQVSGSVAAGDSYLVEPTRLGASRLQTLLQDPSGIAAASLYVGSAGVASSGGIVNNNLGNMTLSAGQFVSGTSAGAVQVSGLRFPLPTLSLQFASGASSGTANFTITSSGATLASGSVALGSSGTAIDIAYPSDPPGGFYQMVLSGTLVGAGDTLTLGPGGPGSNGNAQAMSSLATQGTLNGGQNNFSAQAAQLLAQVATQTHQAQTTSQAQQSLLAQTQAAQQSYSGVNLDQEAANLILYQQAYQAAAKAISIGNTLFQSLMQSL
ncbi:flagellar hook-associated protein FlgK [Candidatus Igneacidithiobacillus taiwanensis]|uniref:flagellar hook-associated protein FlgK n=1 Tax=Candidatus Igneacidithiobacillus taiwanensis TaxID=1945924 RepID=UPI00289D89E7|nr:flagellar hook-associated protein FlgK [Candidatus Igneacidithiobacillus taiwanensis]MCE5359571.1 flagellar hook-associated protein FlgK [Acidithiobacillus sp.]